MAQDLDRITTVTEARIRGTYRPATSSRPAAREPSTAEDCIYAMPTLAEVVKAGYSESYWVNVKAERDAFIRRFNSDPVFREDAITEAKRARAEHAAEEVRRKLHKHEERGR